MPITARRWSPARSGPNSARATASAASSAAAATSASWAEITSTDTIGSSGSLTACRSAAASSSTSSRQRSRSGSTAGWPVSVATGGWLRRRIRADRLEVEAPAVVGARQPRVVEDPARGIRGAQGPPPLGLGDEVVPSAVDPPSTPNSRPRRPWSPRSAGRAHPSRRRRGIRGAFRRRRARGPGPRPARGPTRRVPPRGPGRRRPTSRGRRADGPRRDRSGRGGPGRERDDGRARGRSRHEPR